jgi:hypothetical protein
MLVSCLVAGAAHAASEPVDAVAGVVAAFRTHPVVALSDAHGLAEEGEFYNRLVADPRFRREVHDIVVEFGGAASQARLDRYVAGEPLSEAELRRVLTDAVGWTPAPTSMMYRIFFERVRAVNLALPPAERIRVWLGEPEIDWSAIRTRADFVPFLSRRDQSAASLVEREVLSKGRKALLIYGGLHFNPTPVPPGAPPPQSLKQLIEAARPGALFVVHPYQGYWQPDCTADFERGLSWPVPSLVPRDAELEARLLRPGCTVGPPPRAPPGAPPISQEMLERMQGPMQRATTGANADALLYLGPAATLTRSPDDPAFVNDAALAAEMARRTALQGGPPPGAGLVLEPRPYGRR